MFRAAPAGSQLRVVLANVTNPPTPGSTYTATVSTSSDTTLVASPAYTITAGNQSVTGVSAPRLTSSAASAAGVDYEVDFTLSGTGGLASESTVTVTLPAGTMLPGFCGASVYVATTSDYLGCGGATSPGGRTITVNINQNVLASTPLRIFLDNVTNPSMPDPAYTLTVSTSSDTAPVASLPYSITAGNQSVTGVSAPRLTSSAASATGVATRWTSPSRAPAA